MTGTIETADLDKFCANFKGIQGGSAMCVHT